MPGIGLGNAPVFQKSGVSWSSYWATLISATVEDAAPTNVVLTFPNAKNLVASDFTIAGFTISSASWAGAVLTLVLSTAVVYGDSLTVTFVTTGSTHAVTNNVAATAELTTYITGLTTPLSSRYRTALNNFIKSLKSGWSVPNLSDIADVIYIFRNETPEASLKNLVKNAHHGSQYNSPPFTTYKGLNGNGSSVYIDTNYNVSTEAVNYTQNSAAFGVIAMSENRGTLSAVMGIDNGTGFSTIYPLYATNAYYNNNAAANITKANPGQTTGLILSSRTASNRVDYLMDGVSIGNSSQASQALLNLKFYIFANNKNNTRASYSYQQLGLVYLGRGLSPAEAVVLKNGFDAFKNTVNLWDREMVLERGETYNGWKADAIAAPSVCWDGTRYVMTVSLWDDARSKWASAFFTSTDLLSWSYVNNSLRQPGGSDYILGNGGIAWYDNKYFFCYNHYASVSPAPLAIEYSTNLLDWTSVVDPLVAYGADPSLAVNPVNGRLEVYFMTAPEPRRVYLYDTSDGTTWTDRGIIKNAAIKGHEENFGAPGVFYIGTVRYMVNDGGYPFGHRLLVLQHSVNRDTTWIDDGIILEPNSNAWEDHAVSDCSVIVADINDGRGSIPRVIYVGSINYSGVDDTESSLGIFHLLLNSF